MEKETEREDVDGDSSEQAEAVRGGSTGPNLL